MRCALISIYRVSPGQNMSVATRLLYFALLLPTSFADLIPLLFITSRGTAHRSAGGSRLALQVKMVFRMSTLIEKGFVYLGCCRPFYSWRSFFWMNYCQKYCRRRVWGCRCCGNVSLESRMQVVYSQCLYTGSWTQCRLSRVPCRERLC